MSERKNLAIVGIGIIGVGPLEQGNPALVNALAKLQETYSITLYSLIPINKTRAPKGVRVRCISKNKINLKLQYIGLILQFSIDHLYHRFDLIHAQSPYPAGRMAVWLNKFFKIPWVLFLDASETIGMPEVSFGDLLNPHLKKVTFDICAKAKTIVALTQFQVDMTRQHMNMNQEIIVLPRGITVPHYVEKFLAHPIRFLHISHYHPIKDYSTLFKTFSLIANQVPCELVVVGDNYGINVKELVDSLGIRGKIKFLKAVPNENLHELFSNTHILLHTSVYESQGVVALEAMAHGVVVCGTHVGIMADLSGRCCITVPPGEYLLLASEILKLLNNKERYQQLSSVAYSWVTEHDLQWYTTELEKVYKNAIYLNE